MKFATAMFRSKDSMQAQRWAELYSKSLVRCPKLTVTEAIPPAIEKADGWYRFMVQIRSDTSKNISSAWRWITKARPAPKDVRIAIDIDALNMM